MTKFYQYTYILAYCGKEFNIITFNDVPQCVVILRKGEELISKAKQELLTVLHRYMDHGKPPPLPYNPFCQTLQYIVISGDEL